jgi:hypothetical protein
MDGWRARLEYQIHSDGYALFMARRDLDGATVVPAITLTRVQRGPMFELPPAVPIMTSDEGLDSFLQVLMDAAWERGIRPKNYEGTASQIGAMKDHLNDMRAIVGKQLGVTLP